MLRGMVSLTTSSWDDGRLSRDNLTQWNVTNTSDYINVSNSNNETISTDGFLYHRQSKGVIFFLCCSIGVGGENAILHSS